MRGAKTARMKCHSCPYFYSEEEWLLGEDGREGYCTGTYFYCSLAEQGEKCPFSFVRSYIRAKERINAPNT